MKYQLWLQMALARVAVAAIPAVMRIGFVLGAIMLMFGSGSGGGANGGGNELKSLLESMPKEFVAGSGGQRSWIVKEEIKCLRPQAARMVITIR